MGRIEFIDEHAARPVFARRNPRRSAALLTLHEAEQVIRLGFRLDGSRWQGTPSEASRLSECMEALRFHLATHPELRQ